MFNGISHHCSRGEGCYWPCLSGRKVNGSPPLALVIPRHRSALVHEPGISAVAVETGIYPPPAA